MPDTLRYYEKIGVIPVVGRTAGGVRNYDDEAIGWVENAQNHGVTQKEIAAIIAHTAFYAGWPKGWAVFNMAKEIWTIGEGDTVMNPCHEERESEK